jgi:branched-chain amino acid aminotransferase
MTQGKPKYAFFNGEIVPIEDAQVSIMTHALNYGTAVFGGLRGYWNPQQEQLFIFRPVDHFTRLLQSARLMRIEIEQTPQQLAKILTELLRKEGFRENCYIRPLAYKSTEGIGVRLHDIDDSLAIFALPFGRYVAKEEGAHVCFSAWRRVEDNAIPARGKISGAYANSALIKSDAVLAGYDEALVLDRNGHVSEASSANVFIIRGGVAITPPVYTDILEGINRRSMLQLLQDELGVPVVERDIDRTEVYLADEVFLCGTGVQIAAVTQVEHRAIGSGEMGPVTARLRDLYFDVVVGQVEKYHHWLAPVYHSEAIRT